MLIRNKYNCCGCTACASICKHHAIEMTPDDLGFLYPQVDYDKCVNCGLCESVCSFNDNYDKSLNLETPLAFAARHKNVDEIMKSRSGAVFAAISDFVLEEGGVVYGAGFKDHFQVSHSRATTKTERDEFRGSKYVQSNLSGILSMVKEDLQNGLLVLFSGTPCQTSGVNAFVGHSLRENLILLDIVCHGVPSPYIWRDYLDYIEKKQGAKLSYVNFRDKELYGWKAHKETFGFENEKGRKCFNSLFYNHVMFRHSCEKCPFANFTRPSDITLGDYWGWERIDTSFAEDDKGCSLILINTRRGKILFEKIKDDIDFLPTTLEKCSQPNLLYPTKVHPHRDCFEKAYVKYGFQRTMVKYGYLGWRLYIKNAIKKIIR